MVCVSLKVVQQDDQPADDEIHTDGEYRNEGGADEDHDGRAFQLIPTWPGAFSQFFPGFLNVSRHADQAAAEPQSTTTIFFCREAQVFQKFSNACKKPERGVPIQGNSSKKITVRCFFITGFR